MHSALAGEQTARADPEHANRSSRPPRFLSEIALCRPDPSVQAHWGRPVGAKVSRATYGHADPRKCRCTEAKVCKNISKYDDPDPVASNK